MKRKIALITTTFTLVLLGVASTLNVDAQRSNTASNAKGKMIYHGGRVLTGPVDVYLIWYGCWVANCGNSGSPVTVDVIETLAQNIGATPYFALNTLYTNGSGQGPSGALFYGRSVFDQSYSHGSELSEDDIKAIVKQQIESLAVPQDPNGIYIVLASADVSSVATGFCTTVGAPPLHGNAEAFFSDMRYGFVGNPNRCPSLEGSQFVAANGALLPTPNGDFAGDAMASTVARVVNNIESDPWGDAWYDRYGLESADKCFGTFGQTYTTANGARANVRWGQRDYLIQQNWVNDHRSRCALSQ